eukprot:1138584-Amphidinium_carterae.1
MASERVEQDEKYVAFVVFHGKEDCIIHMLDLGLVVDIDKRIKEHADLQAKRSAAFVTSTWKRYWDLGSGIYDQLVRPLRNVVQADYVKYLIIAPDAKIGDVSFAGLPLPDESTPENPQYVVDEVFPFTISYVAVGTELVYIQSRHDPEHWGKPVIWAAPKFQRANMDAVAPNAEERGLGRWAPVPGTAKEAEELSKCFAQRFGMGNFICLTDEAATGAAMLHAKSPLLMHAASHAFAVEPETVCECSSCFLLIPEEHQKYGSSPLHFLPLDPAGALTLGMNEAICCGCDQRLASYDRIYTCVDHQFCRVCATNSHAHELRREKREEEAKRCFLSGTTLVTTGGGVYLSSSRSITTPKGWDYFFSQAGNKIHMVQLSVQADADACVKVLGVNGSGQRLTRSSLVEVVLGVDGTVGSSLTALEEPHEKQACQSALVHPSDFVEIRVAIDTSRGHVTVERIRGSDIEKVLELQARCITEQSFAHYEFEVKTLGVGQ